MKIPQDGPAVPAEGSRPARPARTERFDKLYYYLGSEGRKCLKGLDANGIDDKDYDAAHTALSTCFGKTSNNIYQFHVLRSLKQGDDSMDKYYRRVKEQKELMKLEDLTKEELIELIVISHLVDTTKITSAKKKCLKDGLNLKQFLDHCRSCEQTDH